jgi:hypothetical protein
MFGCTTIATKLSLVFVCIIYMPAAHVPISNGGLAPSLVEYTSGSTRHCGTANICMQCITKIYLHIQSTPEPTSVLRQLAISYIYMNLWSIDRKSITHTFYNVTRCK